MLEFKKNRWRFLTAKTEEWAFQINESTTVNQETARFWVVAVRNTENGLDMLDTGEHRRFETVEEAMEFCEGLAAGTIAVEKVQAEFEAKDAERERRAIREATDKAKAFRDRLEKLGISYTTLLVLIDEEMAMGEMAHRILLGYERGEGFPDV